MWIKLLVFKPPLKNGIHSGMKKNSRSKVEQDFDQ